MLELREARYFAAVAEELHFGRAAERLHMSQPPLSQAIKGLEHRLGVELLHRTTRQVTLTNAGAVFLDRCRALLGAAEEAGDAARAAASGRAGRLRVGAVTSAFRHPLPRALEHFRAGHPDVDVRVFETDTHLAVQGVLARELDLAFVRSLATPPDCVRVTLYAERFVLALPASWAAPPAGTWQLADAAELPWIWIPRDISPDYHDQVVACCRAAGFALDARHTARSISSQLAMVACGLGVALVPQGAVSRPSPVAGVQVVPVEDSATIDLAVVWRRGSHPVVEGLLTSARTVLDPAGLGASPPAPGS